MGCNQTIGGEEKGIRAVSRTANSLKEEKGHSFQVIQVQNLTFHSRGRAMVAKVFPPGLDRGWSAQLHQENQGRDNEEESTMIRWHLDAAVQAIRTQHQ